MAVGVVVIPLAYVMRERICMAVGVVVIPLAYVMRERICMAVGVVVIPLAYVMRERICMAMGVVVIPPGPHCLGLNLQGSGGIKGKVLSGGSWRGMKAGILWF